MCCFLLASPAASSLCERPLGGVRTEEQSYEETCLSQRLEAQTAGLNLQLGETLSNDTDTVICSWSNLTKTVWMNGQMEVGPFHLFQVILSLLLVFVVSETK